MTLVRTTAITRTALLPLLGAFLVLPAAAAGADLHVTVAGSGSCTVSTQGCSLATALAMAAPGDRILVHGGAYRVTTQLQDRTPGVQIMGAPGDSRPVLDLSAGTLWLTHGTGLSTIDLSTTSGTALVDAGGVIDRVRVGVSGAGATGVTLGSGALLRNSTVLATATGATGVHVNAAPGRATIVGSTLVASGAGASAVNVSPDAPATQANLRAVNTILSGSSGALDLRVAATAGSSASATLHHSATAFARQSVIGDGASIDEADATLTEDPVFVDRASGDLRQAATSPTIDAGTTDVDGNGISDGADHALMGPLDLDGDARQLGAPDIGADEHDLPPMIVSGAVTFDGAVASLQLTVQPNGQTTSVSADWTVDSGSFAPTPAVTVSGSDPVPLSFVLGAVPPSARLLSTRVHASSKFGAATGGDLTVSVPASAAIASIISPPLPSIASAIAADAAAASATKVTPLPGALPSLVSPKSYQRSAQYTFRLLCQHSVSCRGQAILTRVGGVRSVPFKIPAGQVRSVKFNLTSAQREHVRFRGREGLRGLLEIRSLDQGSSWTAIRLFPNKKRAR